MPESLTRRARPFDLRAPAVVAGITSERWPASNRNPGRHHAGIPGRNASESAAYSSNGAFISRSTVDTAL